MDRIEEVRELLREELSAYNNAIQREYFDSSDLVDSLATEIDQLYEPQPDQSRLLTGIELDRLAIADGDTHEYNIDINTVLKKQDAKTARIYSSKIKEIVQGELAIQQDADQFLLNAERAKHAARIEALIEAVEEASHPMNTNMSGISLGRDAWERIKATHCRVQEERE